MGYIVRKHLTFLQLDGPFHYPKWVPSVSDAKLFTYAQAHSYAHAYGGDVMAAVMS